MVVRRRWMLLELDIVPGEGDGTYPWRPTIGKPHSGNPHDFKLFKDKLYFSAQYFSAPEQVDVRSANAREYNELYVIDGINQPTTATWLNRTRHPALQSGASQLFVWEDKDLLLTVQQRPAGMNNNGMCARNVQPDPDWQPHPDYRTCHYFGFELFKYNGTGGGELVLDIWAEEESGWNTNLDKTSYFAWDSDPESFTHAP